MAATWLQSWRLSSVRTKLSHLRKMNGSLLLYKDMETQNEDKSKEEKCDNHSLVSAYCSNRNIIKVGDLLYYRGNKYGITVFPKLTVDSSDWIGVPGKKTYLPIELSPPQSVPLSDSTVYIMLEVDVRSFPCSSITHSCRVEDFGVARAWRAGGDLLSILLESDDEHVAKLTTTFMHSPLSIGIGLELFRIQSVDVKGRPCLLLNADSIPSLRLRTYYSIQKKGFALSKSNWMTHVNLLRCFSVAAKEATCKNEVTRVDGHRTILVVPRLNAEETVSSQKQEDTKSVCSREMDNTLDIVSPLEEIPKIREDFEVTLESQENKVNILQENSENGVTNVINENEEQMDEDQTSSITSLSAQPGSVEEQSSTTASSFGSLSRLSTDTLVATASPQQKIVDVSGNTTFQDTVKSSTSTTRKSSKRLIVPHNADTRGKPPNILVFSESASSVDSVKAALSATLEKYRYTVYSLNLADMIKSPWLNEATLVVVCGTVPAPLVPILLSYVLQHGGSLFCLCSDLLGFLLPTFRTAEVRPDELVTFSYSKWKHVRMMHHIFCYQPSPASAKFCGSEEQNGLCASEIPTSIEILDKENKVHTLTVKVLGAEETWQTPSLIIADASASGGKVIFSQVHLEVDPTQYENEEDKALALKDSNKARLEILADLLQTHLGLHCGAKEIGFSYLPAYFLGTHELKQELMDRLKTHLQPGNMLKQTDLSLKFCGKGVTPPDATASLLPVLMYSCPDTFSTVTYFENLGSKHIGRLVIYCNVISSSMAVLNGIPLAHGLAVIPCKQTSGTGRGGNIWLSPEGCAMFSLQLHIPLKSELGRLLPFLQHTVSVALVNSICSQSGLEDLDLGLKWPNDIYAGSLKIGGLFVTSVLSNTSAICNIGCGFNLNNKLPTLCLNDMIEELAKQSGRKIEKLSFEKYFALVFTELERLLYFVETGHQGKVIELYYKYWLHGGSQVDIIGPDGISQQVTIIGIDEFGFLKVQGNDKTEFSVQPDGNSFDMLAGLIAPKTKT